MNRSSESTKGRVLYSAISLLSSIDLSYCWLSLFTKESYPWMSFSLLLGEKPKGMHKLFRNSCEWLSKKKIKIKNILYYIVILYIYLGCIGREWWHSFGGLLGWYLCRSYRIYRTFPSFPTIRPVFAGLWWLFSISRSFLL